MIAICFDFSKAFDTFNCLYKLKLAKALSLRYKEDSL